MLHFFLIRFNQFDKTRSLDIVLIPVKILKMKSAFEKRRRSRFFLRHFRVSIQGSHFTYFFAVEFELNSKSASIPMCCIHKCIKKYELTCVVLSFLRTFS